MQPMIFHFPPHFTAAFQRIMSSSCAATQLVGDVIAFRRAAAAPRTAPLEKGTREVPFIIFWGGGGIKTKKNIKERLRRSPCLTHFQREAIFCRAGGGEKSFSSTSAALILLQNTKHLAPPFYAFHHNQL